MNGWCLCQIVLTHLFGCHFVYIPVPLLAGTSHCSEITGPLMGAEIVYRHHWQELCVDIGEIHAQMSFRLLKCLGQFNGEYRTHVPELRRCLRTFANGGCFLDIIHHHKFSYLRFQSVWQICCLLVVLIYIYGVQSAYFSAY